jgi:hypothetical protein
MLMLCCYLLHAPACPGLHPGSIRAPAAEKERVKRLKGETELVKSRHEKKMIIIKGCGER